MDVRDPSPAKACPGLTCVLDNPFLRICISSGEISAHVHERLRTALSPINIALVTREMNISGATMPLRGFVEQNPSVLPSIRLER